MLMLMLRLLRGGIEVAESFTFEIVAVAAAPLLLHVNYYCTGARRCCCI